MTEVRALWTGPVKLLQSTGAYGIFISRALRSLGEVAMFRKSFTEQLVRIGVESIPVVILASAFAGVVLTIQTAYQLQNTVLTEDAIGSAVIPTLMLEMSALVPGLVLASRIGASIAAEIGTMRVTEQIDALESMGMNSVGYLVVPRIAAGTLMFPALYIASLFCAVLAGGYAAEYAGYLSFEGFIRGGREFFNPFDAYYGMTKMIAFGFLITSISCWKGFTTKGGADGVGRSTTSAVVVSCVNILFADYLLAELLL